MRQRPSENPMPPYARLYRTAARIHNWVLVRYPDVAPDRCEESMLNKQSYGANVAMMAAAHCRWLMEIEMRPALDARDEAAAAKALAHMLHTRWCAIRAATA